MKNKSFFNRKSQLGEHFKNDFQNQIGPFGEERLFRVPEKIILPDEAETGFHTRVNFYDEKINSGN